MNEYGFDYMNYITNIPSNMMDVNSKFNTNQSNMLNMDSKLNHNDSNILDKFNTNQLKDMMNKFKISGPDKMMSKNKTLEPYQGFIRGNLFENLYDPYKNYKPQELNANNEREALLYQVMQYKFALTELNLYLDTNPNDKEAIELFNKYQKQEKQMSNQYESMYGPLTLDSNYLNNDIWTWKNNPWPWEVI